MDKWETFSKSKSSSSSSESGASRMTIGLHVAYFDGSCLSTNQAAYVVPGHDKKGKHTNLI